MAKKKEKKRKRKKMLRYQKDANDKLFAVIGLGRMGSKVAINLAEGGAEVIAIDSNMQKVEEHKDLVGHAICLDSTDEEAMKKAGIQDVDVAVIALGNNVEANILTTALVKDLGVEYIVARASSTLQERILRRMGTDRVIFPEKAIGEQIARNLLAPGLIEIVSLISGHSLAQVIADERLAGKSLRELDLRAKHGVHVVTIQKNEPSEEKGIEFKKKISSLPDPDYVIEEGDIMMVVGTEDDIKKFTEQ